MKYQLLQALLPHLEAYEKSYPKQANLQHFAVWLARQSAEAPESAADDEGTDAAAAAIAQNMAYLHKHLRNYARRALEGSPLGSLDEYQYLAILVQEGAMSKTDLFRRNRHEKPTGMEIIRRLVTAGLIVQHDDTADRRSKRLEPSAVGRALLQALQPRMELVVRLLSNSLNPAEKLLLVQILEKMEAFHQLVLAKSKGGDFAALLRAGLTAPVNPT